MLETVKSISAIVLPSLSFLLSLMVFITNEKRARRKEKEERKTKQNGAELPPRSTKHR